MLRLMVALLMGIAASAAVAVAAALWAPITLRNSVASDSMSWPYATPTGWPAECRGTVSTALGYTREVAFADTPTQALFQYRFRAGWPFRSFHAQWTGTAAANTNPPSGSILAPNGWTPQSGSFPWPSGNLRTVPLDVLWIPATVNTAFFAAIWFALTGVRRTAIRWRRSRSGLCVVCGHRRGTSSVCPECGAVASIAHT